jgi:hypothetical protein
MFKISSVKVEPSEDRPHRKVTVVFAQTTVIFPVYHVSQREIKNLNGFRAGTYHQVLLHEPSPACTILSCMTGFYTIGVQSGFHLGVCNFQLQETVISKESAIAIIDHLLGIAEDMNKL